MKPFRYAVCENDEQTKYRACVGYTMRRAVKTRNAWQSLAYSPLGATVSPLSKTKPC